MDRWFVSRAFHGWRGRVAKIIPGKIRIGLIKGRDLENALELGEGDSRYEDNSEIVRIHHSSPRHVSVLFYAQLHTTLRTASFSVNNNYPKILYFLRNCDIFFFLKLSGKFHLTG